MSEGEKQPTDEELVALVLAGDRDRYADLVQRYQGRLVNYLYRMLRNRQDCHDVAQEVFIKVYDALDRFDPKYRFSTWVFRIAQNAAIDRIRKRRLRTVSMHRNEPGEDGGDWDLPDDRPSPYNDARNVERAAAIREAIADLPPEYRELIQLRHHGELSYAEIAELKEMPLGTVKNKLFRGRQMLKEELADYLID